jgi:2-C-methyl-D-erythritol 4-phosphate cytidylyltransferase
LIDSIIIVIRPNWITYVEEWIKKAGLKKAEHIVNGGITRKHSILNGLEKARSFMKDTDIIMIHDAARPLINPDVIKNCIETAVAEGSAMAVIRSAETIYFIDDESYLSNTMPRTKYYIGQTPACFKFGLYYQANKDPSIKSVNANSSCDSWFQKGYKVAVVPGDPNTFKITDRENLERFRRIICSAKIK